MPWKNGQGVTSEIEIHPENADFAHNDFNWRLSSAAISGDNNFSKFPGYDRLLTVLSGTGLTINKQSLTSGQVLAFAGEDSIQCILLEDRVVDLSLIFKRGWFEGGMTIITFKNHKEIDSSTGIGFIIPLNTSVQCGNIEIESGSVFKLRNQKVMLTSTSSELASVVEVRITDVRKT